MSDQRFDTLVRVVQTVPSRRKVLGGTVALAVALGLAAGLEEATAGNAKKRLREKHAEQLERDQGIASDLKAMEADIAQLEALAAAFDQTIGGGGDELAASLRTIAWGIESKRHSALARLS